MRIRLKHAEIERVVRSPAGPVFRRIASYTRQTENRAKQKVNVDTGRLRSSIQSTLELRGKAIVGRVGSLVDYAAYVHNGTGVYGPKRRPIRPVSSRFLVFTPKGSRTRVFAREVQGYKGNPYLADALREVVPWPVVARDRTAQG